MLCCYLGNTSRFAARHISFIVSTARPFVLRAVLAMMWAANPLFYAFAHCVGSEALSLILLLLLATTGIKIVTQPVKAPVALWLASGLLISLSMLTRHVNGVLAALLPLAIGFAGLSRLLAALSRKSERERSWLLRAWRKDFRLALLAVALGIASIMLAKATFRVVSHAAGLQYHTRIGFAFMFRLNFFGPLTPVEREPLLEKAAAHSRSPDVQSMLSALRTAPTGPEKFDAMALLARAGALLPPETAASADKSDAVLNETARAFLVAPSAPYLKAVEADLIQSQRTTILAIVRQLIQSTESYFLEPANMPKCQNLVTFRDPRSREILHQLHKHPYFGFWKRFTYAHLLSIWGTLWIYVALLPRAGKAAVAPCAAALTVVGLLFVLATCIVNEFQPRFTLPAWELTIVSTTLLIGSAAEFLRHDALERSTSRQRKLRPISS